MRSHSFASERAPSHLRSARPRPAALKFINVKWLTVGTGSGHGTPNTITTTTNTTSTTPFFSGQVAIFREDGFDELLLKRELQLFITVSGAVKVPRAVRIGRNSNRSVRRGFVQGWCDGSTSRVLFVLKLHSMTSKLCCVQLR